MKYEHQMKAMGEQMVKNAPQTDKMRLLREKQHLQVDMRRADCCCSPAAVVRVMDGLPVFPRVLRWWW